jgi:hypothetical protein
MQKKKSDAEHIKNSKREAKSGQFETKKFSDKGMKGTGRASKKNAGTGTDHTGPRKK